MEVTSRLVKIGIFRDFSLSSKTLVISIALFFSGIENTRNWKVLGYISNPGIPLWIVMLSAPLGAVFLAFFAIEHIISDIRSIGNAQKSADSIVEHK